MGRPQEVDAVESLLSNIEARYGIVIPVYDESTKSVMRLVQTIDREALAIIVVNRNVASPWTVAAANTKLIQNLREQADTVENVDDDHLWLLKSVDAPPLLVIDRTTDRFVQYGVGEARGIGADVLAHLMDKGRVASRWLHQTDADTMLPSDYFSRAEDVYQEERSSLCMRGVRCWSDDPAAQQMAELDDLSGRMAFLSYQAARCPWAMLTTGCGIAVSRWAYREIGGIQPYLRAEDGHLINSAAKVGLVHRVHGKDRVLIEARPVSRPPSGHGAALGEMLAKAEANEGAGYTVTHPSVWQHVAAVYGTIEACVKGSSLAKAYVAGMETAHCVWPNAYINFVLVADMVHKWVGPLEQMRSSWPSPAEAYVGIHTELDIRKSSLITHDIKMSFPSCSLREALAGQPWASLQELALDGTLAQLAEAAFELEEDLCSGDTGPMAWAEKIFT